VDNLIFDETSRILSVGMFGFGGKWTFIDIS